MVVLNPNNWHWVDKNTLPWTKEYFNDKIKGFEVKSSDNENPTIYKISEIKNVSGDSNVSQRKGKPICYFDLNVELTLIVITSDDNDDEDQTGTILLPEFMHDETDFEIRINGLSNDIVRQMNESFIPDFRNILLQYQTDLLETHSQDLKDN